MSEASAGGQWGEFIRIDNKLILKTGFAHREHSIKCKADWL